MKSIERAWRGSRNDWRLHLLSIFSVAVAFVCLAAAVLVLVNVHGIQSRWARAGRLSVFLQPAATQQQTRSLERALKRTEGVTDVRFVSSEQAQRDLVAVNDDEVLGALPAKAFPASLEVRLDDELGARRVDAVAAQLRGLPAVESVETYGAWSQRLGTLLTGGVTAAALLAFVVLAAVISVVSSTIRLSLQRRRIEVEVLKLVGATDGYVRRPFLLEGAAQGAIGSALAVALLGALFAIVTSHLDDSFGTLLGVQPSFLPLSVTVALVLLGAMLGASAAFFSLRKLVDV